MRQGYGCYVRAGVTDEPSANYLLYAPRNTNVLITCIYISVKNDRLSRFTNIKEHCWLLYLETRQEYENRVESLSR